MGGVRSRGLLSVVCIVLSSISIGNAQEEEFDPYAFLPPQYIEYRRLPYAELVSLSEAQRILQRFVDQKFGKGFKYLGENRDFFHGHFLFRKGDLESRPLAILWHTQERVGESDYGPMEYVDRFGRNWIQFLDGDERIVNAYEFVDPEKWNSYAIGFKRHYTLVEGVLNIDGEVEAPAEFDIHFRRIHCESVPPMTDEELNRIEIILPNQETACLLFVSQYCHERPEAPGCVFGDDKL